MAMGKHMGSGQKYVEWENIWGMGKYIGFGSHEGRSVKTAQ
jgi:hypothetical protein